VHYVIGRPTLTNARLAAAFRAFGHEASVVAPTEARVQRGDVALARLDVRRTLDGVEDGLWRLADVERAGALLLNGPAALLNAHDKLATAVVLGRAGVPHPRTAHVRRPSLPSSLSPPYVVKPRFGSWGRDVFRCETESDLVSCFAALGRKRWFRRQGALVQELVRAAGADMRVVVAGGEVVGAVSRVAPPAEWRTNVALGAARTPVVPSAEAGATACEAAAAVGLDLAGVDLVPGVDGRHLVLEVNGAVELTPEYGLEGGDPFRAAVDALIGVPARRGLALAT
jgi:RimK family alpha-L-glutamate ligase